MCNLFVNSLKTKGETFTVKSAENVEKNRSMDTFPMRFLDVLFSDEDDKNNTQELPCDIIALTKKPSAKCQGHEYLRIQRKKKCVRTCNKLPQERKISLIMSIFDKLAGNSNDNKTSLPNLPKEMEDNAAKTDSDSHNNCEETSCSSNNSEDCSSSYKEYVRQIYFQNCNNKKQTSAPTSRFSSANEGFDVNGTGLIL